MDRELREADLGLVHSTPPLEELAPGRLDYPSRKRRSLPGTRKNDVDDEWSVGAAAGT